MQGCALSPFTRKEQGKKMEAKDDRGGTFSDSIFLSEL